VEALFAELKNQVGLRRLRRRMRFVREQFFLAATAQNLKRLVRFLSSSQSIAQSASLRPGPWHDFYDRLLHKGMKPAMARLTLARKIAAITLMVWKRGEHFDPKKLSLQVA
jgi:hypothetical protein